MLGLGKMSEDTEIPFSLTEKAAKKIKNFMDNDKKLYFRVGVVNGGCSGFMYQFTTEDSKEENDQIVEKDGAKVIVNAESMGMIKGCTIDYEETIQGASFKIENPNAKSGCGCGKSFS